MPTQAPPRLPGSSGGQTHDEWIRELAGQVPGIAALTGRDPAGQRSAGYFHTLHEICQQPLTWPETADIALARSGALKQALGGEGRRAGALVLTGSGSSLYAAESVALFLQASLAVPVVALSGGQLLTDGSAVVPPGRPRLVVSFARSGNSPESCGAVDLLLERERDCRHLLVTCNREGALATRYRGNGRVDVLALADRTCDRSLVMTSSFTNMVLAARLLGMLDKPVCYRELVADLARAARRVLLGGTGPIAALARTGFRAVVYLASGCAFGAAREAALKMVEITGGGVRTFAETYLGLRHGPMSAVHGDTLVVCFLSSDPMVRAYEVDLIEELNRKGLGARKMIVGEFIPGGLIRPGDLALEVPGMTETGDSASPVLHVLTAQLLAFFRSLADGLKPDAPSDGVINRVVESFRVHHRPADEAALAGGVPAHCSAESRGEPVRR